uniref:Uncharacterized protein n=1 Tax=Anopheles dirus TaxID=7168 RepID=A0A182NX22_9DIPT
MTFSYTRRISYICESFNLYLFILKS